MLLGTKNRRGGKHATCKTSMEGCANCYHEKLSKSDNVMLNNHQMNKLCQWLSPRTWSMAQGCGPILGQLGHTVSILHTNGRPQAGSATFHTSFGPRQERPSWVYGRNSAQGCNDYIILMFPLGLPLVHETDIKALTCPLTCETVFWAAGSLEGGINRRQKVIVSMCPRATAYY